MRLRINFQAQEKILGQNLIFYLVSPVKEKEFLILAVVTVDFMKS